MTAEHPPSGLRLDEPLDDGMVLISTGLGTGRIYHVDTDCDQAQRIERGRRAQRVALEPLYRPCACCGDGDADEGDGHADLGTCPRCGVPIKQLSTHLPVCDGGGGDA